MGRSNLPSMFSSRSHCFAQVATAICLACSSVATWGDEFPPTEGRTNLAAGQTVVF